MDKFMISYLNNKPWLEWTREERVFCAMVYEQARKDAKRFAQFVADKTNLAFTVDADWDVGLEVCFYRDFLWHHGNSANGKGYSPKRTFDLCLFSEDAILIIEAKVFGVFKTDDAIKLKNDVVKVKELICRPDIKIYAVALASTTYFSNHDDFGKREVLDCFDGKITWSDLFNEYSANIFEKANSLYKSKPKYV